MTQPTPAAAELQAALTWDTPPTVCPICTRPLIEHFDTIGSLIADYECGQTLRKDKEADSYSLSPVRTCRNWAIAAVAQRQRAEDAERDYAVLLKDYNAAAAWLGVLESGDDLEVAAKRLTDNWSDAIQRADVLAAQVAALRTALDSIVEYAGPADDTGNSFWQCRACGWPVGPIRSRRDAVKHAPDCAYIAAKSALPTAPDPNAPSLDDFTHWPFPPEMPPPEGEQP